MLEVSLFGKPTIRVNALEVALSTRKALGLVGYLALEGATSRAKLADLLWGELDDSAARTNLRQELRRIRATTLEDHLLVEGDALNLKAPLETDVTRFQNAIKAEHFEAALEHCKGVFLEGTQWRGAPAFQEWVDAWRETLSSQRRNALKRQAVALEAAGNPRGALAAHLTLLEEDELQEHHHREAMRLHSMLGERKEALARFERCRQILQQELGLEPLPETLRLAERIRSGRNLSLKPAKAAPSENPFQTPPMIGRDQFWTQLETSEASLILIEGEPGVGKTRLATEFVHASGNTLVLSGQELSSGTPLFPVASALRAHLASQNLELETIWRHEAARLVPELEPDAPSAATEALPEGRARFLEGLTHALIAAVQQSGTLLLDDFHWFDATSSELMVQLSKRAKAAGIKLIATARPSELSENPAATRAIQHLERDGLLTRISLEPLNETMILSLIQALSGSTSGTIFAKRLFDATAGNPLFVLETLRDLLEAGTLFKDPSGVWSTPYDAQTEDYAELPLAQSVRQAVLQRIDRLRPAVRRMLDAASLTGDDFQLSELTQATALDEWLGLEALERASSAGILRPNPQGHRFHHDLIRRSLSNALGADRRKLLHKRLAATLEANHGQPARIADHLEQADLKTQAAPWRIKAAEAARAVYAYRDALVHYARALELGVSEHEQFRIHTARAALWKALDERIGWSEDVHAAIEIATYLGERNLEIESGLGLAEFYFYSGQYHKALEHATEILEQQDVPNEWMARAHLEAGNAMVRLGRIAEAEKLLKMGLERAPKTAFELIGRLNNTLANCDFEKRDVTSGRQHFEIALTAFRAIKNYSGEILALNIGSVIEIFADNHIVARSYLKQALASSRFIGYVPWQRLVLSNLANSFLYENDFESALPLVDEGLQLSSAPKDPRDESTFLSLRSLIQRANGNFGGALKSSIESIKIADTHSLVRLQIHERLNYTKMYLEFGDVLSAFKILKEVKKIQTQAKLDAFKSWFEILFAHYEVENFKFKKAEKRLINLFNFKKLDLEEKSTVLWLLAEIYMQSENFSQLNQIFEKFQRNYPLYPMLLSIKLRLNLLNSENRLINIKDGLKILSEKQIPAIEALKLRYAILNNLIILNKFDLLNKIQEEIYTTAKKLANSLEKKERLIFLSKFGFDEFLN